MKRNQRKFRKGFTLVEMLGVLAIIAILMSIVAVGVLSAINRTRIVATMSNFKNLETAILGFVALPEASGKLPITKAGATVLAKQKMALTMATNSGTQAMTTGETPSLHLEIPFLSSGLLERNPTWRVGSDGIATGQMVLAEERGWNRNKGAFSLLTQTGGTVGTANDWSDYVRAECAPVDNTIALADTGKLHTDKAMMKADGVNFYLDGTTSLPSGTRVAYVVIPGLSLKDAAKLSEELNGTLNETDLNAATPVQYQTKGRFVFAAPGTGEDSVTGFYFLANI